MNRRRFLQTAIAGAGSLMISPPALFAYSPSRPLSPGEFRKRLRGPILSFPTPYTQSFQIDTEAVGRMIERAVKGGVKVVTLTNGNNQYDRLSFDEIKELTRLMVKVVDGRGTTIAATGPWWTGQAVDYARFAESVGADALQVLMSPHGEEDAQLAHFQKIASVTKLPLVIHGQPGALLMKRLMTLETVAALKEEFTTDYTVPLYSHYGDRLNIFAGGSKARLLAYYPYGMRAYYSAFSTFAPEIAFRFWHAMDRSDLNAAKEVVLRYDIPFMERWSHPFWRATLEHFGVAKRYLRPPEASYSDQQMQEVKAFYQQLGLSPTS